MPPIKEVSVKEVDYLDQDPPLRGQNFVCLSFISPEDIIKKKEVFFFENFLQSFSKDIGELFTHLSEKFKDDANSISNIKERYQYIFDTEKLQEEYNFFVGNNSGALEKSYLEQNDFQTSIRGIKVRGTFDTLKEAEIRAQVLKRIDDKFHVYVAEVGCWCPWSPNPDEIENQEYAETQLNTLMSEYKKNQAKKDEFFQQRKRELQMNQVKTSMEGEDPWTQRQQNSEAEGSTVTSAPVDANPETPVQEGQTLPVETDAETPVPSQPEEVSSAVVETNTDAPVEPKTQE